MKKSLIKFYLKWAFLALTYSMPSKASFFNVPQVVTPKDYEQLKLLKLHEPINFTWYGPAFKLVFFHEAQQVSITMYADEIAFHKLPGDIQKQFRKITDKAQAESQFSYVYTWDPEGKQKEAETEVPYFAYDIGPHYCSHGEPLLITIEELALLMLKKRVLFYTGAGISACNVPDMKTLEKAIGFVRDNRRPDGVKTIVNIITSEPDVASAHFASFVAAAIEAPTTPAHRALGFLCNYAKTSILSENVDLLQEAAGIKPLFTGNFSTHELCTAENLKQIDIVICIGLSHDDRGFIGLYKQHNPQAKVIALDFKAPEYLDSHDMLLKGDIQQHVPLLWNSIDKLIRDN